MNNIKLKGAKNLRDLAGLKGIYGTIKPNKILRGPALDNLYEKDIDILVNKYKLKTVIDLRTDREKDDRYDIRIPGVTYYHMPVFKESTPGFTHEDDSHIKRKTIDMTLLYKHILDIEYLNNISKIIKKILNFSDNNYSTIIHCSEGKDRTGVIILILLLILGINKNTIMEDYLYTNKVNKKKAKRLHFEYKYIYHDKKRAENVFNIFLAKEEYLNQVFNTIETKWSSLDSFFKEGLKLTDTEITNFRNNVLN